MKSHYRKVFKSDHLSSYDLEDFIEKGMSLKFTIKEVKQEINVMVAGKRGNYNIAYFKENIKPLVLNATNSKVVRSFNKNSSYVEDWINTPVELYIQENIKFGNDFLDGIRIKKLQPKIEKEKAEFTEANFDKASKANATIETIKKSYKINLETEKKYLDYVAKNS